MRALLGNLREKRSFWQALRGRQEKEGWSLDFSHWRLFDRTRVCVCDELR